MHLPVLLYLYKLNLNSTDEDNRYKTVPKNDENTYQTRNPGCSWGRMDDSGSHLTFSVYSCYCFVYFIRCCLVWWATPTCTCMFALYCLLSSVIMLYSETTLVVASTFSAFLPILSTPRSLVMRSQLLPVAIYVSISFYTPSSWESPRLPRLLSWAGRALSVATWKGQEAQGQLRWVSLHWCWQHGLRLYQLTQVRKNKWN